MAKGTTKIKEKKKKKKKKKKNISPSPVLFRFSFLFYPGPFLDVNRKAEDRQVDGLFNKCSHRPKKRNVYA